MLVYALLVTRRNEMTNLVLPLLQTEWGQSNSPADQQIRLDYASCVSDLGNWTNNKIGCVSVAIAQILFYHRLKPQNSPVPGYVCIGGGRNQDARRISLAFGNSYFFELFPNSLDPFHLSSNQALAELQRRQLQCYLFDVARAIRKNFHKGYLGSSAQLIDWLKSHFGVTCVCYHFSADQAADMAKAAKIIAKEVTLFRPVYLAVNRTNDEKGKPREGHAMVIDGFKSDANGFWITVKSHAYTPIVEHKFNGDWYRLDQPIGKLAGHSVPVDGNERTLMTFSPPWHGPDPIIFDRPAALTLD